MSLRAVLLVPCDPPNPACPAGSAWFPVGGPHPGQRSQEEASVEVHERVVESRSMRPTQCQERFPGCSHLFVCLFLFSKVRVRGLGLRLRVTASGLGIRARVKFWGLV